MAFYGTLSMQLATTNNMSQRKTVYMGALFFMRRIFPRAFYPLKARGLRVIFHTSLVDTVQKAG